MKKSNLVLCPGLLCDARMWKPQMEALSDFAECWVPTMTEHNNLASLAEAVLRAAPEGNVSVAGLSMGGFLALEMVRQAPKRIERLALINTRASPETAMEIKRRNNLIDLARREKKFSPATMPIEKLILHPSKWEDATIISLLREMAESSGIEAFIRQQHAVMSRADYRPGLMRIRIPTLVICGRDDQLTPVEDSEEIAAAIQGARLTILEECGHMSPLEKPAEVTAELRQWLTCGLDASEIFFGQHHSR